MDKTLIERAIASAKTRIYKLADDKKLGVCGFHPFKGYIPETPGFNICPNCGADMRKGGENQ